MKKILSLFLLLNVCSVSAQNYADKAHYLVDSLDLNELSENDMIVLDEALMNFHSAKYDTTKIQIIGSLCINMTSQQWVKYQQFQYDLIVELSMAKPQLEDWCKKQEAKALGNLALACSKLDNEAGIRLLKKSIKIQKELKDVHGLSLSYMKLGKVYTASGDVRTALTYYLKGLRLCEQAGDTKSAATCRMNMGQCYYALENLEQALSQYEKAQRLNEQLQNSGGIAMVQHCLGKTHHKNQEYDKAIEHFENALELYRETDQYDATSSILRSMGVSYLRKNEPENAATYYTEALALSEKTGNQKGIAQAKLGLAQCHLQNQEYEDAEILAKTAFEDFLQLNLSNQVAKTHAVLSKIYEQQEKTTLAFEHYKSFVSMHDSIINFRRHQNGLSSPTGELLTKVEHFQGQSSKWGVKRLAILSGVVILVFLIIILLKRASKTKS